METHEKIRTMRELNQWSQEEMAEKLDMTAGGYAKIERGENSINIERLQQIANIFKIDVCELLRTDKGLIIQLDEINGDNNNHIAIYSSANDSQYEIEKLKLIIQHKNELLAQKDRELAAKDEIIALLKK
ncbi:helix-turn-helix domain-containing protein [Alysiella filiformis]|uniref:Helix-turn-helix n=1 Tax=Alysiella filiformis DSM 16848 TaxID=1120981 RepID=A0A286E1L1_9NEIS|nr:helix-turn-helix transcriptional regulator [Alysiella filiformis]QMT30755.1 helix-turn-helix transcriptional regulator [Alysiella filiformis]UBQ56265.1 helix-turn-helix transcriptional regulator [Alysiella filiformis DSM 16848]SOD64775.1 Helix-turn-helix [Alysiella filiformis DSM 16848]